MAQSLGSVIVNILSFSAEDR